MQFQGDFELNHFDLLEIHELDIDLQECTDDIIFTSYKAAEIGLGLLGDKAFGKSFFCVGQKTEELLLMLELDVISSKPYSKDLAEHIIQSYPSRAYSYLCNENRLDTLPELLQDSKIDCKEFITYRSSISDLGNRELQGHKVYMWYSPVGVNALSHQAKDENVLHVAVGETTAKALIKKNIKSDKILFPKIP